jgi:cell division protein FtsI/penicillin-binding protein 2
MVFLVLVLENMKNGHNGYEVVDVNIQKRIFIFLIISSLLFLGLIGRLVQIQLIDTESFSDNEINLIEQSVEQRTHSLVLNDGRGRILDRNGQLLSTNHSPSLVLFPFASEFPDKVEEVSQLLGIPYEKLIDTLEDAERPFVYKDRGFQNLTEEQITDINEIKAPGIFAQYIDTNELVPYANHFIGVTRENPEQIKKLYRDKLDKGLVSLKTETGIRGIENAFDSFLISEGESKLIYHVARGGSPLFGLNVKYTAPSNPFYPVELKTTLDKSMQVIVESAFIETGIKEGGAVLIDVSSRDVLGMVSRPMFTENEPLGDGTRNKVLETWKPGSIFKLVTAAAAIEENYIDPNRKYDCDQNLYGDGLDQTRKLGLLTFEESFAQSCNYTFGTLAKEMVTNDPETITKYAGILGLTHSVGWKGNVFHIEDFTHFPDEIKGTVWGDKKPNNNVRAIQQTAIGQLDVRLSPIAVANMMATIANGGEYKEVRAATEVMYRNGSTLVTFPEHNGDKESLSKYTIKKLQELLSQVIESPSGTGRSLKNLPYKVAGKSGTAELDDQKEDGPVNSWFAGYFPTDNPKYALVVFELEHTGRQKVQDVFKKVVERLYELDH